MRLAALALMVLTGTAHAEPRVDWSQICVIARIATDEGRAEVVPYAAASLGGGLDRYRNVGGLARLHFADGWVMEMEAHRARPERRLDLPVPALQTRRLGGGALSIGYVPFTGKLAVTDSTVLPIDLVASIGAGIAFVRPPRAPQAEERLALTAGIAMRVRIQPWLSVNLGIHDEALPVGDTPSRTTARTTDQLIIVPATTHELEVRLGLGFWIPDAPGHRCRTICP